MNMHQCELLLRKLSDALADIKQPTLGENAVPVLQELLQSLETITTLIKASCITTAQWPNAAFEQWDMRETFSLLLYDVQWETSLLRSISADTDIARKFRINIVEPAKLCDGQLSAEDESALLAALEKDERSLKHRLRLKLVKDPKAQGLAEELFKQMESSSVGLVFLNPADLVKGTYLKHGGFGAIVRTEFLGMECAMKIVPEYSGFGRELEAVKKLGRHPHVVRTYCHSRENAEFYLIMEKMHMNLSEYLSLLKRKNRSLSLIEAVTLMLQIGEGMNFIHNKANVAHRDLKPQNILVNLESSEHLSKICSVKIADFGSTKEADRTRSNQTVGTGTTDYMAPEVIKEKSDDPKQAKYNPLKADVYSFAIMCSVILTGEKPYKDAGIGPTLMKKQVIEGSLRPKLPTECPLRLATVITTCWAGDHHDRPLFPEICRDLRCIKGNLLTGSVNLPQERPSFFRKPLVTRLKIFSAAKKMKKLALKVIGESLFLDESQRLRSEDHLFLAFQHFDTDNSGFITIDELQEVMEKNGKGDPATIQEIISEVDTDHDGKIDYDEFVVMMREGNPDLPRWARNVGMVWHGMAEVTSSPRPVGVGGRGQTIEQGAALTGQP